MSSYVKLHQVFLVIFLVTCLTAFSNIEARDPVRRYSQLISSSMPALALAPHLPSKFTPAPAPSAPTQAPMLSDTEPENYVYGFYNREVGEFPMATTKEEANAIKKQIHEDDEFMNNDSVFGNSEDTDLHERSVNKYENEYTRNYNNNKEVSRNRYTDFQKRHEYSTRTNDDDTTDDSNMYTTNYNDVIEDDNNDNDRYYTDKFERKKPKTFGRDRFVDNNRRYYNDNGEGYYRGNQRVRKYDTMEEAYEGVYQP